MTHISMQPDVAIQWASDWLERVADGGGAMSQRKLSSVKSRCGLETAKTVAAEKGVHLLLLEDDKGEEFVVASVKPFEVIC